MTTPSYIDERAVAADLVAMLGNDADLDGEGTTVGVSLPDGRRATVTLQHDDDTGIGSWREGEQAPWSADDEFYGTFSWRSVDRNTGYLLERPDGFDGRARSLDYRGSRYERIEGALWWQPPADVEPGPSVDQLEAMIRGFIERDWTFVGVTVSIEDPAADGDPEERSLWGVDYGGQAHDAHLASVIAELLIEVGIRKASTAGIARWARDFVETVAYRAVEAPEDGSDVEESAAYAKALRAVLAWWGDVVEPDGDWDLYGERFTNEIERDFSTWSFDKLAALGCEFANAYVYDTDGVKHGPFRNYGEAWITMGVPA